MPMVQWNDTVLLPFSFCPPFDPSRCHFFLNLLHLNYLPVLSIVINPECSILNYIYI